MPRKYEVPVCTGCGKDFNSCSCSPRSAGRTGKTVTAIDERDVSPLVEAAKLAVKELDYAPPGESERDASCRIQTKWLVEGALKPFEAEEGSG